LPAEFVEAMDDDLGVSGALAVIHEHVRKGNTLLDEDEPTEAAEIADLVIAMTDVLGVNPLAPNWVGSADGESAQTEALDLLIQSQLAARASARAARDYASADAIRDALHTAGIQIDDTPSGARWSLVKQGDR